MKSSFVCLCLIFLFSFQTTESFHFVGCTAKGFTGYCELWSFPDVGCQYVPDYWTRNLVSVYCDPPCFMSRSASICYSDLFVDSIGWTDVRTPLFRIRNIYALKKFKENESNKTVAKLIKTKQTSIKVDFQL